MKERRDANALHQRIASTAQLAGDGAEKFLQETLALLDSVLHSDLASFERHLLDILGRQTKIENGIAALSAQVGELIGRDRQRAAELEALRLGNEIERARDAGD